jgi:hypothetical protein
LLFWLSVSTVSILPFVVTRNEVHLRQMAGAIAIHFQAGHLVGLALSANLRIVFLCQHVPFVKLARLYARFGMKSGRRIQSSPIGVPVMPSSLRIVTATRSSASARFARAS